MSSGVREVDAATLSRWPTKRLLALRDRLLRCEVDAGKTDLSTTEIARLDPARIFFKDDPRWTALYERVLAVLRTREHVASR